MQSRTLSQHLSEWAEHKPEAPALTFEDYLTDRHGNRQTLTYRELDERVTAMAAVLRRSADPGERIAILAPQGLGYVVGFVAALRAGIVAIPLFSPDLPGHGDRLAAIFADCEPRAVLAADSNETVVKEFLAAQPSGRSVSVINIDQVDDSLPGPFHPFEARPDDLAYLQYTSGSTRVPAGVQISHANVVANSSQAILAIDPTGGDATLVSWLPLFHDMGLVFVTGGCVVGGMHAVFMDPISFLIKPGRWLTALSAHSQTITMAPNFAYDYCSSKITQAEKDELRLGNVIAMANGAEPVRPDTLADFARAFGGAGLRANVVRPCYGLAEATVYVCGSTEPEPAHEAIFDFPLLSRGFATTEVADEANGVRMVAVGRPHDQLVAIADPRTGLHLADGLIGEIWVHGPNVAHGYWRKSELSAEVFGQTLVEARELPPAPWLRSGDLGVIHEGELYVTGRIKDLIILDGRNHYPQDLELSVEAADAVIGRHRAAAFAVADPAGREAVVVVAEVSRHAVDGEWNTAAVTRAVRTALSKRHGISLRDIVLVAPNEVPRTSSGKIARAAARQKYLDGSYSIAAPHG